MRTAVLSVGRKNGKSQLAAALCLCHLSGLEAELRGECYAVACTRFRPTKFSMEMVAIITRTPWLNKRINIVRFRKELRGHGRWFDVRCPGSRCRAGARAEPVIRLLRRARTSAEPGTVRCAEHSAGRPRGAPDAGDQHAGGTRDP